MCLTDCVHSQNSEEQEVILVSEKLFPQEMNQS